MMKNIAIIALLILTAYVVHAQERMLSLEECIRVGIESNYDVKIAQNNKQIAENNVALTPFLPSVAANARQNQDVTTLRETPRDDAMSKQTKDYTANLMSVDLGVSWTLFDGMSMFANYKTKQELLRVGELGLRNSVESLVNDIAQQYYYIITQKGRCHAARNYLDISTLRYNQAREKYILQTISGLEMTQAKMDFNADSSKFVTQQEQLSNAYIALYEMMNVDLGNSYFLSDTIVPNGSLELNTLIASAKENNTQIEMSRRGEIMSELELKVARSSRYPTLSFGAGYKYNGSDNSSSSLRLSQSNGLNWGFTLSAPLYNGMDVNRKIKNAKIAIDNSILESNRTELSIVSTITQLYNTYRYNFLLIGFESESAVAAFQNLEAAMVMYKIGTMSGVEFREIQRSYIEAEDRKLSAIFQAKISEISLRYLSGKILNL